MQTSGKGRVCTAVWKLAQPVAQQLGLMLWDVEFVREGGADYLRIYIDKENGVTIDDAEAMQRIIDPLLDEADPIEGSYYLEVSSPGVERELRNDEHLRAYIGQTVRIRLYKAKDGEREIIGILSDFNEESLFVTRGENTAEYTRKEVAKVNAYYDFDRDDR